MKRWLVGLLLAAAVNVFAAGPMGVRQERTNYMVVANGRFECTFFPRHMFPVWFKTPAGREYPEIVRFLDRAKIGDTVYWLYTDLWAEQEILENTADKFVIRCSGVYCHIHGDKVAPGRLRATYTYTIRRNSPEVEIAAEILRDDDAKVHIFFLEPAWSMKLDFDGIRCDGKPIRLEPGKVFPRAKQVTFVKGGLSITARLRPAAPIGAARFKMREGFSTMLMYSRDMKGRELRLAGSLILLEE